jgi:hypothetical protein
MKMHNISRTWKLWCHSKIKEDLKFEVLEKLQIYAHILRHLSEDNYKY